MTGNEFILANRFIEALEKSDTKALQQYFIDINSINLEAMIGSRSGDTCNISVSLINYGNKPLILFPFTVRDNDTFIVPGENEITQRRKKVIFINQTTNYFTVDSSFYKDYLMYPRDGFYVHTLPQNNKYIFDFAVPGVNSNIKKIQFKFFAISDITCKKGICEYHSSNEKIITVPVR